MESVGMVKRLNPGDLYLDPNKEILISQSAYRPPPFKNGLPFFENAVSNEIQPSGIFQAIPTTLQNRDDGKLALEFYKGDYKLQSALFHKEVF